MPSGEISFSLDNSLGQFDPTGAGSLFPYITGNEKVSIRVAYKINNVKEWINNGVFYLTGWDNLTSADKADFVAQDMLTGWKDKYIKSLYNTGHDQTLTDLAEDVLTDMGLTSEDWDIDSRLDGITDTNEIVLPVASHAECLQLIANSAGCCLFVDKDGVIRIKESEYVFSSWEAEDYTISRAVQFINSGLRYAILKDTGYARKYEWDVAVGATTIIDLSIKVQASSSYELNYKFYYDPVIPATLTVTNAPYPTLEERKYSNAVSFYKDGVDGSTMTVFMTGNVLTKLNYQPTVSDKEQAASNVIYIDNIITFKDSQYSIQEGIIAHLIDSNSRRIYTPDFRLDPRLDIADYVTIENPNGTDNIFINSLDVSFNGTFKAIAEGRTI